MDKDCRLEEYSDAGASEGAGRIGRTWPVVHEFCMEVMCEGSGRR